MMLSLLPNERTRDYRDKPVQAKVVIPISAYSTLHAPQTVCP